MYIWPIFTWIKTAFVTGNSIQVLLFTFSPCCALVHRCLPSRVFSPIWRTYLRDSARQFNRGRRRVTPDNIYIYNWTIFGEIIRITHNTQFMHSLLFKHQVYIPQITIIRAVRSARGHIGKKLIADTPSKFVGDHCPCWRSADTLQYRNWHHRNECRMSKNINYITVTL